MEYIPSKKSLRTHRVPAWYEDAKLGIFIHWGLYSVPAFGVTGEGDIQKMIAEKGVEYFYRHNPYGEWYCNSIRIPNSPAQEYHSATFGSDFTYESFAETFNDQIREWDPREWAELFAKAGARYAVITAKHHDGFRLWPSEVKHPTKTGYEAVRDVPGELRAALNDKGLKMGIYYSGILDWSFTSKYILTFGDLVNNGTISREYVAYADAHYRELIERYEPWVLWNDIGYPPRTNVAKLFAYFYNHVPDGVINDRWVQFTPFLRWGASLWGINKIASWMVQHYYSKRPIVGPAPIHCDYRTPEYSVFKTIQKKKWELTRGIGNSFGYNQFETEVDYVPADKLIRMFIDIVSKNGNLLLNVGPQPNGAIHEIMRARLLNLGNWLEVNGEGIFRTRPWVRAEGSTSDGISLRFTAKDPVIYVFFFERPKNKNATIQNFRPCSNARIQLLGLEEELSWSQAGKNMQVTFPDLPESPAYCLRVNQLT